MLRKLSTKFLYVSIHKSELIFHINNSENIFDLHINYIIIYNINLNFTSRHFQIKQTRDRAVMHAASK